MTIEQIEETIETQKEAGMDKRFALFSMYFLDEQALRRLEGRFDVYQKLVFDSEGDRSVKVLLLEKGSPAPWSIPKIK